MSDREGPQNIGGEIYNPVDAWGAHPSASSAPFLWGDAKPVNKPQQQSTWGHHSGNSDGGGGNEGRLIEARKQIAQLDDLLETTRQKLHRERTRNGELETELQEAKDQIKQLTSQLHQAQQAQQQQQQSQQQPTYGAPPGQHMPYVQAYPNTAGSHHHHRPPAQQRPGYGGAPPPNPYAPHHHHHHQGASMQQHHHHHHHQPQGGPPPFHPGVRVPPPQMLPNGTTTTAPSGSNALSLNANAPAFNPNGQPKGTVSPSRQSPQMRTIVFPEKDEPASKQPEEPSPATSEVLHKDPTAAVPSASARPIQATAPSEPIPQHQQQQQQPEASASAAPSSSEAQAPQQASEPSADAPASAAPIAKRPAVTGEDRLAMHRRLVAKTKDLYTQMTGVTDPNFINLSAEVREARQKRSVTFVRLQVELKKLCPEEYTEIVDSPQFDQRFHIFCESECDLRTFMYIGIEQSMLLQLESSIPASERRITRKTNTDKEVFAADVVIGSAEPAELEELARALIHSPGGLTSKNALESLIQQRVPWAFYLYGLSKIKKACRLVHTKEKPGGHSAQ